MRPFTFASSSFIASHQPALRTVSGVVHNSFLEACRAVGLVENDQAYCECLQEMSAVLRVHTFRKLFARILVFCEVDDPLQLWEQFKDYLVADFIHRMGNVPRPENVCPYELALAGIQRILESLDSSLCAIGLPVPDDIHRLVIMSVDVESGAYHEREEARSIERRRLEEEVEALISSLNTRQRQVFDSVFAELTSPSSTCERPDMFFVDGPGGTGKTYLFNTIARKAELLGFNSVMTAYCCVSSGKGKNMPQNIRLANITTGRSIEQHFITPICCAEALRQANLIIIDEVSTLSSLQLNVIHILLSALSSTRDLPLGGYIIVFGGDFRQTLPLPRRLADRIQVVENTILQHPLWKHVRHISLFDNMRARESTEEFRKWLLNIGNGNPTVLSTGVVALQHHIDIPVDMCARNLVDLVKVVFDDFSVTDGKAILTLTIGTADLVNNQCIPYIVGEEKVYLSCTTYQIDPERAPQGDLQFLPENVTALNHRGLPPHILRLRIGCRLMLLRNMGIADGLCNGTLFQVERFHEHAIEVRILTGERKGEVEHISKVTLSSDHMFPVRILRTQFPVRLAYCMTINKSQGQSFDKVGDYLGRDVLSRGQLYVAPSRCRTRDGLRFFVESLYRSPSPDPTCIRIVNVAYREELTRKLPVGNVPTCRRCRTLPNSLTPNICHSSKHSSTTRANRKERDNTSGFVCSTCLRHFEINP